MKNSKQITITPKNGGFKSETFNGFSRTEAVAEFRKSTGCTGELISNNVVYGGGKKSVFITHKSF
jgi:hypothetical protein